MDNLYWWVIFSLSMMMPLYYVYLHVRAQIQSYRGLDNPKSQLVYTLNTSKNEYVISLDGRDTGVRAIPADIRAEIDQTPQWWDRQFHRLTGESGAIELEYGEIEYVEERSLTGPAIWRTLPRPTAYLSCICSECERTRKMGCDPRD